MFLSILYKEWLKIRIYWVIALMLNLFVIGWLFLGLRHLFIIEHAEMIWYQIFEIGTLHYTHVKYFLIITGMIIGAAQFIPEMIGHRFRLSLHLPIGPNVLVLWSALIGFISVGVLAVLDAVLLYAVIGIYFPHEAAQSAFLTVLPWLWAGLIAYMGTALTAMEPQLSRKLVYLAIAGGFVWFFCSGHDYESYNRVLWKPVLVSLLFIPAVFLPAFRYRNRSL